MIRLSGSVIARVWIPEYECGVDVPEFTTSNECESVDNMMKIG